MKDYFEKAVSLFEVTDGEFSSKNIFIEDIKKYREYSIQEYRKNVELATGDLSFRIFLKRYYIAVNIFDLHSNITTKSILNYYIKLCWEMLQNENYDD